MNDSELAMSKAALEPASDSAEARSRPSVRRAGAATLENSDRGAAAAADARRERLLELENWSALLELELTDVHSSRAVRLAAAIRRRWNAALPKSTYRGALAHLAIKAARKARQGPRAFVSAAIRRAYRSGPLLAIGQAVALKRHRPQKPSATSAGCLRIPGLVSVILPVYNQAHLLGESIESVLNQTYADIELIIVNDGSTDDVETVLERCADDPRVRVLEQTNQSLPKALSNGFAFARGEFWTWTSADNVMEHQQLSRLVAFLHSHPDVGMVYADYLAIDESGQPLEDPAFRPKNRRSASSSEIHLPHDPLAINAVPDNFIGPCFLYRGTVGRMIGEYDPAQGIEDYDYWMRVNHSFVIEHLDSDKILYRYRVHEQSLSGRAGELKIADRVTALMQYERERQAFLRKPWTVVFDASTQKTAASPDPRIQKQYDLERVAGTSAFEPGESEKVLSLISSQSLETISRSGLPDESIVSVWFDSVDDVYQYRAEAARFRVVAFTDRAEVAERLELLGITVFLINDATQILDLAIRYANNRAFYEATRPAKQRARNLPQPWRRLSDSPHILMQMDDFDHGGLENVVLTLARGLQARGMKVSLLVLGKQGPAAAKARANGFAIFTLPIAGRDRAYETLLGRESINLVQAHYSTFGAGIAARNGLPFVQVVHNTYVWLDEPSLDWYRHADEFTAATICVSAEVARYCDLKMGLAPSKMIVIPNGVDVNRLETARAEPPERLRDELGLIDDEFVFLNVASIHATKAQTVLVKAFAQVARAHPRARLVIAGSASDADYEARLLRLILQLGLGHKVILAGQRADVTRFYWMADAFVLPSFWEGWSLALTEAVATGLPVVSTDVGGARDLILPGSGELVHAPLSLIDRSESKPLVETLAYDNEIFVNELARSMLKTFDSGRRAQVSDDRKQSLDLERMVETHAMLLTWLLQGGTPDAARAWAKRGHAFSQPDDRKPSPETRGTALTLSRDVVEVEP